jgi:hypothetical protein
MRDGDLEGKGANVLPLRQKDSPEIDYYRCPWTRPVVEMGVILMKAFNPQTICVPLAC